MTTTDRTTELAVEPDSRWVTAHFAGFFLGHYGADPVPSVDLIRQWAHREKIRKHPRTDQWGFARYSLTDIYAYARRRGYFAKADAARERGEDA